MTLVIPAEEKRFDPDAFLANIAKGRTIESFRKNQTVFAQGARAIPCFTFKDSVLYIQKGKVKLTVVSKLGKEATIGILSVADFFGEGCLTGQPSRMMSAAIRRSC